MGNFYVYIIECSDASFYIGVTNNIQRRLCELSDGASPKSYTFRRRPLKLVHVEEFASILDAISREKQLKRWTRAKKKALITNNTELLQRLSRADG